MVSARKKETLKNLKGVFKSSNSFLVFDLKGLPAKQLHEIRNKLKEEGINTSVAKRKIFEKAIEDSGIKLNISDLSQPALAYTDKGIFEAVGSIKSLKTKRKAKSGETAPADLAVPPGNTGIPAGPAISIFKQFTIQTLMKDGKIHIKDEKIVCKEGQNIETGLISLLNMLGIEPIEMFISPQGGYSQGLLYTKDIFEINKAYLEERISIAGESVFKLTYRLGYPTKQNAALLLSSGFSKVKRLGLELGVPAKGTIKDLLRVAGCKAKKLEGR
jgi:large subunit ribosomal protein L10